MLSRMHPLGIFKRAFGTSAVLQKRSVPLVYVDRGDRGQKAPWQSNAVVPGPTEKKKSDGPQISPRSRVGRRIEAGEMVYVRGRNAGRRDAVVKKTVYENEPTLDLATGYSKAPQSRVPRYLRDSLRNAGQIKIHFPSVFMRLVRNQGVHKDDPYTATFRCDIRLTKPDIANYLMNVYGLEFTHMRTSNYIDYAKSSRVRHMQRILERQSGNSGKTRGSYKKVLVRLTRPFWYPEERSHLWLETFFERAQGQSRNHIARASFDREKQAFYKRARSLNPPLPLQELQERRFDVYKGDLEIDALNETDPRPSAETIPIGERRRSNIAPLRAARRKASEDAIDSKVDQLEVEGW